MNKEEIPQIVKDFAKSHEMYRPLEYKGKYQGKDVYCESPLVDKDGCIFPTGLPQYILQDKDGTLSYIFGLSALDLIGNIK